MMIVNLVDLIIDRCKHQGRYLRRMKLARVLFKELLEESKGMSFQVATPTLIKYGDVEITPTDDPAIMVAW